MWKAMRDRMSLADYYAAKDRATDEIIARVARNNVLFQNGLVMDESERSRMSEEADEAMERLERQFGASTSPSQDTPSRASPREPRHRNDKR